MKLNDCKLMPPQIVNRETVSGALEIRHQHPPPESLGKNHLIRGPRYHRVVRTTSHHSSSSLLPQLLSPLPPFLSATDNHTRKCLQLHRSQLAEPSSLAQLFFRAPLPFADLPVRILSSPTCPKLASAIPSFTYVYFYAEKIGDREILRLTVFIGSSRCHVRCFHACWMVNHPILSTRHTMQSIALSNSQLLKPSTQFATPNRKRTSS